MSETTDMVTAIVGVPVFYMATLLAARIWVALWLEVKS